MISASEDGLAEIESALLKMENTYEFAGQTETSLFEIGYDLDDIIFSRTRIESTLTDLEFTEGLLIPDEYYVQASGGDWFVLSPWNQGDRFAELPQFDANDLRSAYRDITRSLAGVVQADDEGIGEELFLRIEAVYIDSPVRGTVDIWLHRDSHLPRKLHLKASEDGVDFEVVMEFTGYDLPMLLPDPPANAEPMQDYDVVIGTCVGDSIESCLPAQDELNAVSTRFCEGEGHRVCLVPIGQVDADLVLHLVEYYRGRYGLPVSIVTPRDLPERFVDDRRGQARTTNLISEVRVAAGGTRADPDAVLIGLTPLDIYNPNRSYNWLFAHKQNFEPFGIISTFRMNPEVYGEPANEELFRTRVRKMVSRYIGVLHYGLRESSDPSSPVYGSIGGLGDLDNMSEAPLVPAGP
jgi:predicted Zn-dependent protease